MPEEEDVENELKETEEEIQSMIESIEENSSTPEEASVETKKDEYEAGENRSHIENGKYIDEATGQKFDTEEGLELFQEAVKQKES